MPEDEVGETTHLRIKKYGEENKDFNIRFKNDKNKKNE